MLCNVFCIIHNTVKLNIKVCKIKEKNWHPGANDKLTTWTASDLPCRLIIFRTVLRIELHKLVNYLMACRIMAVITTL